MSCSKSMRNAKNILPEQNAELPRLPSGGVLFRDLFSAVKETMNITKRARTSKSKLVPLSRLALQLVLPRIDDYQRIFLVSGPSKMCFEISYVSCPRVPQNVLEIIISLSVLIYRDTVTIFEGRNPSTRDSAPSVRDFSFRPYVWFYIPRRQSRSRTSF